jgi:hypothetical protein
LALPEAGLDLHVLIGRWCQLQAVGGEPDAGEHGDGDDERPSAKDFLEDFHNSGLADDFGAGIALCYLIDKGAGRQCDSGASDDRNEGHGPCSDAFTITPTPALADPPKE